MKIGISVLLAFVWLLYASAYAAHRFQSSEWWMVPTLIVTIATGFVAIVALGVLVEYMTDARR